VLLVPANAQVWFDGFPVTHGASPAVLITGPCYTNRRRSGQWPRSRAQERGHAVPR
jgi:hypothetical protein